MNPEAPQPENPDQRHAKELGLTETAVASIRENFNTSHEGNVMRHIFRDRLQRAIAEEQDKLERAAAGDFQKSQGKIAGLRDALALVNQK